MTAVGASGVGVAAAVAYRRQVIVEEQQALASDQYRLERMKHDGQVSRDTDWREQDRRDHDLRVSSARRDRFTTSTQQLANDSVAVRIAGVYTLAGLADEWLAAPRQLAAMETGTDFALREAQTCIDVLCAYLRVDQLLGEQTEAVAETDFNPGCWPSVKTSWDAEVRRSIVQVLSNHLQLNGNDKWIGMDLDFTGAIFRESYDFDGASFHGRVCFTNAKFLGGRFSFERSQFSGNVIFDGAQLSGGQVSFNRAKFIDGRVSFTGAKFDGSRVFFDGASFAGGRVYFTAARFSKGSVTFNRASFTSGEVAFSRAKFLGGQVSFGDPPDAKEGLVSGPWGTATPPQRWPHEVL